MAGLHFVHFNRIAQVRMRLFTGGLSRLVCVSVTLGFFLLLVIVESSSSDPGYAQTLKSQDATIPRSQQAQVEPGKKGKKGVDDIATAQTKTGKKGIVDRSRSTTTIGTDPGSQQLPDTVPFRLSAKKERPYQGEAVHFTLASPRSKERFVFEFDFNDGPIETTTPSTPEIVHRFEDARLHRVTAKSKALGAIVENEVTINVQPLPIMICGVSSNRKPQIFVGQDVSLSTLDLNDQELSYQFVFDAADPGASTRTAVGNSTRGDDGQLMKSATFVYSSSGERNVYARLVWSSDDKPHEAKSGTNLKIEPLPPGSINLDFTPAKPSVNQEITFRASLNPSLPQTTCPFKESNFQYRFVFDDNSVRDWSADSTATYAYSEDGSHKATVEVRVAEGTLPITRAEREISVVAQFYVPSPGPPPPTLCVPCLVIGGVIILVCGTLLTYFTYRIIKKPHPKGPDPSSGLVPTAPPPSQPLPPQVTYVFDSGEQTAIDKGPRVSVSIRVTLVKQTRQGQTHLVLNEGRLIKSIRRHHV